MNIVNKLTIRHLKQNKRRTLVTIIGVIISVAMVTAVATLGFSFMELMKKQSISTNGEWHVQYRNVTKAQLKAIETDDATKALVISNDRGYAPLEGGKNENKPYWYIKEYNAAGFKQFPIELLEGRLPKTNHEVVISEEIAKNAKVSYKIGETLTLDVGERVTSDDENSGNPYLRMNDYGLKRIPCLKRLFIKINELYDCGSDKTSYLGTNMVSGLYCHKLCG